MNKISIITLLYSIANHSFIMCYTYKCPYNFNIILCYKHLLIVYMQLMNANYTR